MGEASVEDYALIGGDMEGNITEIWEAIHAVEVGLYVTFGILMVLVVVLIADAAHRRGNGEAS